MNKLEFDRLIKKVPFVKKYEIKEEGNRVYVYLTFKWYALPFASQMITFLQEYFLYIPLPGVQILFYARR